MNRQATSGNWPDPMQKLGAMAAAVLVALTALVAVAAPAQAQSLRVVPVTAPALLDTACGKEKRVSPPRIDLTASKGVNVVTVSRVTLNNKLTYTVSILPDREYRRYVFADRSKTVSWTFNVAPTPC